MNGVEPSAGHNTRPGADESGAEPAAVGPRDLAAWTLVQTAHLAGRRFHEVFTSQGLSAHQFGILVHLTSEPGGSQAALARAILVTPQSIGEILVQMQNAGLVRRTPAARRGTANRVELTVAGRTVLAATFPLVAAINTPEALGLDEAETRTLNDLLHRVHDHLDDRRFIPLTDGV